MFEQAGCFRKRGFGRAGGLLDEPAVGRRVLEQGFVCCVGGVRGKVLNNRAVLKVRF